MKTPRDYQLAASTALWNQVHLHHNQNPLVVMPTGTGKSLTMALWVWGMLKTYPHLKMLSLTHVKELVAGNAAALQELWPLAPIGIYSAGLKKKQRYGQVTYAGIDSVGSLLGSIGKIDFVIVDEAHRISDNEKSTYQKTFAKLRAINPDLIVIGFTATDYRMGMGKLTDGGLFDVVCFDLSDGPAFVWMIEQGYLIRPVTKNPGVQVDASKVRIKAGEYDEKSASAAFADILEEAVDTIVARGVDRRAWLTFCQSIDECELLADMFKARGFDVEPVHSKRADRDEVLKAFARGELRGVVNKDILTTGYDDPRIDLIAMLRLTRSPGLWVQMLGRGTRPCWSTIGHNGGPPLHDLTTREGRLASIAESHKQNCLVLDFAGNAMRLGPINYPTIPKAKKGEGGSPPLRECPQCGTHNHISLRECEECGYVFPVEQKRTTKESTEELVVDFNSLPPPPPKVYEVVRVDRMFASVQKAKPGKWPTLRVDYFTDVRRFSTWVCPEHPGFPQRQAQTWWKAHSGAGGGVTAMPKTASEAADRFAELGKPYHIKVCTSDRFPSVEAYDFMGTAFELPPELGGPDPAIREAALEAAAARAQAEQARMMSLAKEMFDDDIPF